MPKTLLLPDVDLLRQAFDRHDPSPLVVSQVVASVEQRRLLLVGWVRQGLMNRAQNSPEAARLARALAPFPDLPIIPGDHVAAAFLSQRLRRRGMVIQPAQALHWVMADRIDADIWSLDQRWHPLHRLGCPVVTRAD